MLGLWPYIEADFLRDYGIDLCYLDWLRKTSWRRFSVLMQGLSPKGAVAAHYSSVAKKEAQEQEAKGPDAGADAFWAHVARTGKPSGE